MLHELEKNVIRLKINRNKLAGKGFPDQVIVSRGIIVFLAAIFHRFIAGRLFHGRRAKKQKNGNSK
jgi:hypothetical protein